MAKVKVFCMTRDEYDLIEHFILYYGYLFGYENVIIIDNNSINIHVLEVYEKYIKLGLKVFYESNYKENGQGDAFTKYMHLEKSNCDFLVGLDTDEFLFTYDEFINNKDPVNKIKIQQIFDSYDINDTLFKIDLYPCSAVDPSNCNYKNNKFENPAIEINYFSHDFTAENINMETIISVRWQDIQKYFVRSTAFIETTCGNHSIKISHGNKKNSLLGLFHFNNTGSRRSYERSKLVIDGYNYFSTSDDIKTQIDFCVSNKHLFSRGSHKVINYHLTLLRMYIIELYIPYIKRLPSIEELKILSNGLMHVLCKDIENHFKNSQEAIEAISHNAISVNDTEKNNLIFYDESIKDLSLNYNIFKTSYLQNLLKKLLQPNKIRGYLNI